MENEDIRKYISSILGRDDVFHEGEQERAGEEEKREHHARTAERKVPTPQDAGSSSPQEELGLSEDISDSESADKSPSEDDVSAESKGEGGKRRRGTCVCEECGVTLSKPALLTQHIRSHSDQRPFACPKSGCGCAYKRQDHLNRHLKKHQGVVFFCSQSGCNQSFTLSANLQRHLKRHAESDDFPRVESSGEKTLPCLKPYCGKLFRYPSHLQTHVENVHQKLQFAEFVCLYPGCGDKFSTEKALVRHAETSHPYLLCEVCGETISRKSFTRHVRNHGRKEPRNVVCFYEGCGKSYTRESNLNQHVRSVHLKLKPFTCSHKGCGKLYAHKVARDRHELSAVHSQPTIDFQEQDQLRLLKPRGGRKRDNSHLLSHRFRERICSRRSNRQT